MPGLAIRRSPVSSAGTQCRKSNESSGIWCPYPITPPTYIPTLHPFPQLPLLYQAPSNYPWPNKVPCPPQLNKCLHRGRSGLKWLFILNSWLPGNCSGVVSCGRDPLGSCGTASYWLNNGIIFSSASLGWVSRARIACLCSENINIHSRKIWRDDSFPRISKDWWRQEKRKWF